MLQRKQATQIFIFSGPGGAGKTTLVKEIFREKWVKNNFIRGISITTRQKRPGEKEGKDYIFKTKEEFLKLKQENFFLESEEVTGNYYGTPKSFYEDAEKKGKYLILCIDVKGGMYLKERMKQCKIITIFISAPTQEDLKRRLSKRVENKTMIKRRIELAKKELQFSQYYDYLVINQNLKDAKQKIYDILKRKAEDG